MRILSIVAAATFSVASLAFAAPTSQAVAADDAMAMGSCAQSGAMMSKMMHTMPAMKMSGNTDTDYMAMMKVQLKNTMAMAKMEMKCGKSESAKAMAQEQLTAAVAALDKINNDPHNHAP